jgi:plasmid stability protein
LHAGDAGDHLYIKVKIAAGGDAVEDSQRAVIQAGVAPDQEGPRLVFFQLPRDRLFIEE